MGGFPTRPTRTALGPLDLDSSRPSNNPQRELAAKQAKLVMWQLAGLGFASPMYWAEVSLDGSVYTVGRSGCAPRPDSQITVKPTVSRTSAGVLAILWPASVLDEEGNTITTDLVGGLAIPQGLVRCSHAQEVNADGRTLDIRFWSSADNPTDFPFFVVVW
jgi:hypothetical protein